VWCQAVFYLSRKYGDAKDLAVATGHLPNIRLLGEKHPEVLKARAGRPWPRTTRTRRWG